MGGGNQEVKHLEECTVSKFVSLFPSSLSNFHFTFISLYLFTILKSEMPSIYFHACSILFLSFIHWFMLHTTPISHIPYPRPYLDWLAQVVVIIIIIIIISSFPFPISHFPYTSRIPCLALHIKLIALLCLHNPSILTLVVSISCLVLLNTTTN